MRNDKTVPQPPAFTGPSCSTGHCDLGFFGYAWAIVQASGRKYDPSSKALTYTSLRSCCRGESGCRRPTAAILEIAGAVSRHSGLQRKEFSRRIYAGVTKATGLPERVMDD